jgi:hypothetical protein
MRDGEREWDQDDLYYDRRTKRVKIKTDLNKRVEYQRGSNDNR